MRMIAHAEVRQRLQRWPKFPGCRPVRRAPLITAGFPGTFNMSSTEHHWLKEYGGYVKWDHDFIFTTVQSCIRLNDFTLMETEHGWRYLGVFEMADLSGEVALSYLPDYRGLYLRQIAELIGFFEEIGLSRTKVHASYCTGGRVADLTKRKYGFEFQIPPDELSREAFLAAGVPEENLIPDATRDTLLSLHVHRATPWGYRNEIYVETAHRGATALLDVATSEYFLWTPIFAGSERADAIVGLEESKTGAFGVGCGIERLCLAANGLARVHEVDYLQPFYSALGRLLGGEFTDRDYVIGESLRALHRIQTDLDSHPEAVIAREEGGRRRLSTRRRKKVAALQRNIPLGMTSTHVEQLLYEHSRTQLWHERLEESIEATVKGIEEYRNSHARKLIRDH
jgi:hypothetical protein